MHWPIKMAALLLATNIMAQPIAAAPAQPEPLQDSAVEQIKVLMQEKKNRTPAQRKMESHLIHAAREHRHEFISLHGTNLQFRTHCQTNGLVLVDMDAEVTPAVLAAIEQAGGKVIAPVPSFHAIRALLPVQEMETLAARSDVRFIKPAVKARTHAGSVMSEGYYAHGVNTAVATYGVTGAGMKIGVLSDSVDYLAHSQTTGDLGPVTVLEDDPGNSGEGTAMLEIVHDLAPNASLYFATAYVSEADFANNILALRQAGCNIIIDDVTYFDESPFQDGILAKAVNQVTTNGVLYFSAAGNGGNLASGTSGTWEGDFVNGGSVSASSPIYHWDSSGELHNFGGLTYNKVTYADEYSRMDLFWSDPLGASDNDYDLFVLNSTGSAVVDGSNNTQDGTQDPYESVDALIQSERIVVVLYSGNGRFLHMDTGTATLTYNTSGGIRGHQCATNAFAVAAVDATAPQAFAYNPANLVLFTTAKQVESYSSDGPRRIFYYPDGTPITPGNFSSTGGMLLQKPDLAAADGVMTTVTNSVNEFQPFFGTSAAAPHAAAIAALLWSYRPSLTPTQIRSALTFGTLDIGTAGWDVDAGNGIVVAMPAMQNVLPRLTVTSVFGSLAPGSLTTNMNTPVSESITSPAINGTTQYVCIGATVASNASIQVSLTNVTLTLTNDATLTWNWLPLAYWLSVVTNGPGTIASTPASGWCATGTVVSLAATPSNYWSFSSWTGDVNGIVLAGNTATATMSQARSIIGSFAAILATNQTPLWWLAQYGLPANNAGAMATSATPGMLNWQKYIAELNPTNPASVLEITSMGTNGVAFSPVATDRVYSTYFSTNLVSSNWVQNVFHPGTGTTMFIAFTNQTAKGYYRVGVQLP